MNQLNLKWYIINQMKKLKNTMKWKNFEKKLKILLLYYSWEKRGNKIIENIIIIKDK